MISSKPLVSIAMATFNGQKYIREQLNSLVNQTYPKIEVIITDDCSLDNTTSIIKEFQAKFSTITLFLHQQNKGVTKTFENSIKNCTGEFIALSDQDDIWDLNKIDLLVNAIGKEDAIYSNSLLVNEHGLSLQKEFSALMNVRSYYSGAPFLLSNCVPGHTILMKNSFAKTILPFPGHIMFDRWISYNAAANNGIKFFNKPLVKYRQHGTNTIGVGKFKNRKQRETAKEKFNKKLAELKTFSTTPVKSVETKMIVKKMLELFNHNWSLKRSLFFFRNSDKMLVIKNKSNFRKILYCIKMFFKPNY